MSPGEMFARDYALLEDAEGGLANDPRDPGGETAYGISRRWHGHEFQTWPPTPAAARDWYRRQWTDWGLAAIDHHGLRAQVFLKAVNSDIPDALLALQCALRGLGHKIAIDGKLGPQTRRALIYADQDKLLAAFRAAALMHYRQLQQWERYSSSWLRRVDVVQGD